MYTGYPLSFAFFLAISRIRKDRCNDRAYILGKECRHRRLLQSCSAKIFALIATYYLVAAFCSLIFFMSLSYFSWPTHSRAAGHHSIHDITMSLVMVFPHPLQFMSGSSDHISFFWWQKTQTRSSGDGLVISLLPGQLSFIFLFYH